MTSVTRRVPRQARAEQRIEAILEAAAAEIAEHGYSATTLTAVAARAGTSIGSLYQYFPDRLAIARALAGGHAPAMIAGCDEFRQTVPGPSIEELADQILAQVGRFLDEHPAYLALSTALPDDFDDLVNRSYMLETFGEKFRRLCPGLGPAESHAVAEVVAQSTRGLKVLCSRLPLEQHETLHREHRLMLTAYLRARLGPGAGAPGEP